MTTLEYYFAGGCHVVLDKYTMDPSGNIIHNKSGKILSIHRDGEYNVCSVQDNYGKKRKIRLSRAIASTLLGPPPSSEHTADHIDRNTYNDTFENIRWLCKSGQANNQTRPKTVKSAFIIVKDGIEKNANDWVAHFKDEKNSFGREYTTDMLIKYAQKKQYGYSYKEYPDIPEEIWKEIGGSKTIRGRWEISNMNRVKYVTIHAENVLSGDRLGLDSSGYPFVKINGQHVRCHVLSFATFFPEDYAAKKINEIILHESDDKNDFRPHKLRLGTCSDNRQDAHDNGIYEGKKSSRVGCASYVDDVFEKEYTSQHEAVRYLFSIGFNKVNVSGISQTLKAYKDGKVSTRYDRTWRTCDI